jgi:nucleotide-binding universal stress UspA family protein
MYPIRSILLATDFSAHSAAAAALACALARDYGARLHVLHVLPLPILYGEGISAVPPDDQEERATAQLEQIGAGLEVGRRLSEGDPATEILEAARTLPCDLIVLGTHGRTGLRRLLMGSVSEEVVRKAPCPVLIVKTPHAYAEGAEDTRTEPAAHAL